MTDSTADTGDTIDRFSGRYAYLSNFAAAPVSYAGIDFPTVEHAFQAAKSEDTAARLQISRCKTAAQAKKQGRGLRLRPEWGEIKRQVMYNLLLQKFAPGTQHLSLLLQTGDRPLVEGNTWGDVYWGVDHYSGKGENHLGRLLMEVRAVRRRDGNQP